MDFELLKFNHNAEIFAFILLKYGTLPGLSIFFTITHGSFTVNALKNSRIRCFIIVAFIKLPQNSCYPKILGSTKKLDSYFQQKSTNYIISRYFLI